MGTFRGRNGTVDAHVVADTDLGGSGGRNRTSGRCLACAAAAIRGTGRRRTCRRFRFTRRGGRRRTGETRGRGVPASIVPLPVTFAVPMAMEKRVDPASDIPYQQPEQG